MAALLARGPPSLKQRLRGVYAAAAVGVAVPQRCGRRQQRRFVLLAPCQVHGLMPFRPCANLSCSSLGGPSEAEASRSYVHTCGRCPRGAPRYYCSAACMEEDWAERHGLVCAGGQPAGSQVAAAAVRAPTHATAAS